ncbi:leucine-rich PPR motif-containing protein, mitochondrial [Diorhabda sublineata]|uniref:leucine-rich PPR motif-containing protein, mitochondrial n=1 Tax=Diorhabda sublineata TaxID=1163346 RepID=UPI0024E13860|nr:leucine-rich PPR motif-containing protein, mitochondrial [Diorhabda sublineata]XP_056647095.1 leucine-rich PPR motif-containing protein, mitochondrial [Diorhabda sublineata]XP_056647096.1 leucine-rich PPR motif-containing protein, mitochondrial [Diorhabda sublineata]
MFHQSNCIKKLSGVNLKYTSIFKNRNVKYISLGIPNFSKEAETRNSINIAQESKHLNLKPLSDLHKTVNFQNITSDEGHLLLLACGASTFKSSQNERNIVCQNLYANLEKYNKLDLRIYNSYIKICTENRTLINCETFLDNLKCEPSQETLKLLFQNVCESGDVNQAFNILELMKNKAIAIDESVFNDLVLVHTLNGGIKAAEIVLETMKTAHILETPETYFAMLKGIIQNKNHNELNRFLKEYSITLNESKLLVVLKELGINQSINWLPQIKPLFSDLIITRELINNIKNICIHLVHMGQSDSALEIFNYFQQEPEENSGLFILEEMLSSGEDFSKIIDAVNSFRNNDLNEYICEKLTEIALKRGYFDISCKLFEHLKEIRPHFFWPLFLNAYKTEGETGIFKVIELANKLNVHLDSDSFEYYIVPYCSRDDLIYLIEKFKKMGFTVKFTMGPLLRVLLKEEKINEAAKLCEHFDVHIGGDRLFKLICSVWKRTKNRNLVSILKKIHEYNKTGGDLLGDFLVSSIKFCKNKQDFQDVLGLLQDINKNTLKITITSADALREIIHKQGNVDKELCEEILDQIDQILEFKLKIESDYIPHPRDMKVDELECHLVELMEKGLETRGTLRRLIQMHVNLGNISRVKELRKQFIDSGYEESLGMKSSLLYSFIKNDNLESALNVYEEIRTIDPKFHIDHFKLIDMAALLVRNGRCSEALNLIENIKIRLGFLTESVQRNCVELLNEYKDENEQMSMFNILIGKGLCKINNIMLGPLIKIFLVRGDLENALNRYCAVAEQYKFVPLQFEIIRDIAKSQNEEYLQRVLDTTTKVRGPISTQVILIAVFAELGKESILRKLFATTKIPIQNDLKKRCERWIKEGKSDALLTLANSCDRLSTEIIDINFVYQCIIKTFALNNDCVGAVKFYEQLVDKDVHIDRKLENDLYLLLKQHKCSLPVGLRHHNKGR